MRRLRTHLLLLLVLVLPGFVAAQKQVVLWPNADQPVVRFTFLGFGVMVGPASGQRPYAVDTITENLSATLIGNEHFVLYVLDNKQTRIGDGSMDITNLGPGQSTKLQVTITASGIPASVRVLSQDEAQKPIALTVNSSPQGALLKVDGVDAGATPKVILVGPGKHQLAFSKDAFRSGAFPLEIGANDVSGGTVDYKLAPSPLDTIELRDGTVISGDLDSIQGMDVVVRVGGALQRIDRNNVKSILLAEREPAAPSSLPPAQTKPQ